MVSLTAKWQQRSSGSSSSRTRGTPNQEAAGGARRQTETAKALARAATGGRPLGRTDGGTDARGPPPEIEMTAGTAEIEIGRRARTGVQVATEIGGSSRRATDETYDRNGLTSKGPRSELSKAEKLLVRTVGAHPEDQVASEPCKLQHETVMGSPSAKPGKTPRSAASVEQ